MKNHQQPTKDQTQPSRTNVGQPKMAEPRKDSCKCDAQAAPLHNEPALQFQKKHPGSVMLA